MQPGTDGEKEEAVEQGLIEVERRKTFDQDRLKGTQCLDDFECGPSIVTFGSPGCLKFPLIRG